MKKKKKKLDDKPSSLMLCQDEVGFLQSERFLSLLTIPSEEKIVFYKEFCKDVMCD